MTGSEQLKQKRHLWKERITLFQKSGQSVAEWCSEQDIPEHQLRYWLRKNVDKESSTCTSSKSQWVALEPFEESTFTGVTLRVGSVCLDIQRGFEPQVLIDIVRCLASLC